MPIFGRPLLRCLDQLGRQKNWNVGSPMSGQSGLSSLVPEMGNSSIPDCPGPCREAMEGWCGGGPLRPQRGPCKQPSHPGSTFSHTVRDQQLPPGRLQEHGPDPVMLRASSTAELSNCHLSVQDHSEESTFPRRVPDFPQPPGLSTLQQGFTSLPTATVPYPQPR